MSVRTALLLFFVALAPTTAFAVGDPTCGQDNHVCEEAVCATANALFCEDWNDAVGTKGTGGGVVQPWPYDGWDRYGGHNFEDSNYGDVGVYGMNGTGGEYHRIGGNIPQNYRDGCIDTTQNVFCVAGMPTCVNGCDAAATYFANHGFSAVAAGAPIFVRWYNKFLTGWQHVMDCGLQKQMYVENAARQIMVGAELASDMGTVNGVNYNKCWNDAHTASANCVDNWGDIDYVDEGGFAGASGSGFMNTHHGNGIPDCYSDGQDASRSGTQPKIPCHPDYDDAVGVYGFDYPGHTVQLPNQPGDVPVLIHNDEWHSVEVELQYTSSSSNRVKLYVDGILSITRINNTLWTGGGSPIAFDRLRSDGWFGGGLAACGDFNHIQNFERDNLVVSKAYIGPIPLSVSLTSNVPVPAYAPANGVILTADPIAEGTGPDYQFLFDCNNDGVIECTVNVNDSGHPIPNHLSTETGTGCGAATCNAIYGAAGNYVAKVTLKDFANQGAGVGTPVGTAYATTNVVVGEPPSQCPLFVPPAAPTPLEQEPGIFEGKP